MLVLGPRWVNSERSCSRFDEVMKKFYYSGKKKKNEESFSIKLQTTLIHIITEALKP